MSTEKAIVISENLVSVDGYDFIKLDMRGLKKAVKYKHSNPLYYNYIGLIMLILGSNKYEVYLPVSNQFPTFIYSLCRKTIILDSLLFHFNGGAVGFHEKYHPFLFKYNKLIYKKIEGFGFYDFSILNYIEQFAEHELTDKKG